MVKKTVSGITLTLLLIGMLTPTQTANVEELAARPRYFARQSVTRSNN